MPHIIQIHTTEGKAAILESAKFDRLETFDERLKQLVLMTFRVYCPDETLTDDNVINQLTIDSKSVPTIGIGVMLIGWFTEMRNTKRVLIEHHLQAELDDLELGVATEVRFQHFGSPSRALAR